jgi:hypothetical protein
MKAIRLIVAAVYGLILLMAAAGGAAAQKTGGILKVFHRDSPASMSIHEEATWSTTMPMMGVFNNLVLYDQHVKQNSLKSSQQRLQQLAPGGCLARPIEACSAQRHQAPMSVPTDDVIDSAHSLCLKSTLG